MIMMCMMIMLIMIITKCNVCIATILAATAPAKTPFPSVFAATDGGYQAVVRLRLWMSVGLLQCMQTVRAQRALQYLSPVLLRQALYIRSCGCRGCRLRCLTGCWWRSRWEWQCCHHVIAFEAYAATTRLLFDGIVRPTLEFMISDIWMPWAYWFQAAKRKCDLPVMSERPCISGGSVHSVASIKRDSKNYYSRPPMLRRNQSSAESVEEKVNVKSLSEKKISRRAADGCCAINGWGRSCELIFITMTINLIPLHYLLEKYCC